MHRLGRAEDVLAGNAYQSVKLINRDQKLEGIHPVVRTHPETGRRRSTSMRCIQPISLASKRESKTDLGFLAVIKRGPNSRAAMIMARPATFAIWDNRAVQHSALNDYQGKRREMWRISIAGETPA